MKPAARIKKTLSRGALWLNYLFFRRPLPDRIAIYFHAVDSDALSAFEEALDWLTANGYRYCSPKEYLAAEGPPKRAFVSFDDNYVSWWEQLPVFERHRAKCTFYANTLPLRDRSSRSEQETYFNRIGYHGKRVPLSSQELNQIAAAGHTIACHTHSHRKLSDLPEPEGKVEMQRSKDILEDIVAAPVDDFSYPFGMPRYFPSALRGYAREIGFLRIAEAMPCMMYSAPSLNSIERHGWRLNESLEKNLSYLRIDGRLFVKLCGRSPVG